jgi:hypothetical protein
MLVLRRNKAIVSHASGFVGVGGAGVAEGVGAFAGSLAGAGAAAGAGGKACVGMSRRALESAGTLTS